MKMGLKRDVGLPAVTKPTQPFALNLTITNTGDIFTIDLQPTPYHDAITAPKNPQIQNALLQVCDRHGFSFTLSRNLLTPCSFFKTLTTHVVTVELKNDISIRGTLKSVDQYLNIKLDDITVLDEVKYPHLSSVKNVFIRGSVVRYVHLPASEVDRELLEDATRRG
jgi:U6 snRNA-associated Sm-like protein LSm2